jgi:hypothetical protein
MLPGRNGGRTDIGPHVAIKLSSEPPARCSVDDQFSSGGDAARTVKIGASLARIRTPPIDRQRTLEAVERLRRPFVTPRRPPNANGTESSRAHARPPAQRAGFVAACTTPIRVLPLCHLRTLVTPHRPWGSRDLPRPKQDLAVRVSTAFPLPLCNPPTRTRQIWLVLRPPTQAEGDHGDATPLAWAWKRSNRRRNVRRSSSVDFATERHLQ